MSKRRKNNQWSFPSTYTILFVALILLAILTYIMPAGYYDYYNSDNNSIVRAEDYSQMSLVERKALNLKPMTGTFTRMDRSGQLLAVPMAAVKGFYDSIEVVVFVLFMGGFLGVITRTRAIDVGIANLMQSMNNRIYLLMALLIVIFSLGGISYGMGEETIAFYPILLPIMVVAGFDVMVGASVILLGAGAGVLTSILNPFATGIASNLAGVKLIDGMGLRVAQWLLFMGFTMFYVIRYAKRVYKNPELSVTHDLNEQINKEILHNRHVQTEKLTLSQRWVLVFFVMTFSLMVFSLLPFSDWNASWATFTLGWEFPQIAALFFMASIGVGLVAGLNQQDVADSFVSGAKDVLGVVFVLVLSRGLKVIMEDGMIIDTILAFAEKIVRGLPNILYINIIYLLHMVLALFIPSTSGLAGISMPIMAPLAEIAGVSESLVITAYQSASGLVNMVSPTSGILMGALMVARIPYERYIRFAFKYLLGLFIATVVLLTMGVVFHVG